MSTDRPCGWPLAHRDTHPCSCICHLPKEHKGRHQCELQAAGDRCHRCGVVIVRAMVYKVARVVEPDTGGCLCADGNTPHLPIFRVSTDDDPPGDRFALHTPERCRWRASGSHGTLPLLPSAQLQQWADEPDARS